MASPLSISSCGSPLASLYRFSRQLLRRPPRLVKTAITSLVSTEISRSDASETSGVAPDRSAGGRTDSGAGTGGAGAAAETGCVAVFAGADGGRLGTGFTTSAWYTDKTRNERKIARRTRLSITCGPWVAREPDRSQAYRAADS